MVRNLQAKYAPSTPQLREFYLCGIRTGYPSTKVATKAAEQWSDHTAYSCEYCPGVHHVKAEALLSSDKLQELALSHWNSFIVGLGMKETVARE